MFVSLVEITAWIYKCKYLFFLHKYLTFQGTDAFKITIYSELLSKQERNTLFTLILFFVTLYADFYSGWHSNYSYTHVKSYSPQKPAQTFLIHKMPPAVLEYGRSLLLWRAFTVIRDLYALSFPYSHQRIMYVAIENTCWSHTATISCNASLHIFLQQIKVCAEGLESKCILGVICMCMGIKWYILIWRNVAY